MELAGWMITIGMQMALISGFAALLVAYGLMATYHVVTSTLIELYHFAAKLYGRRHKYISAEQVFKFNKINNYRSYKNALTTK
jgi:hypothetical protein